MVPLQGKSLPDPRRASPTEYYCFKLYVSVSMKYNVLQTSFGLALLGEALSSDYLGNTKAG